MVMFDRFRGVLGDIVGEGTHFLVPWVQTAHVMDIRTQPRQIVSVTGTKDLQMVNISLRVLVKPEEVELPNIFKQYGVDWYKCQDRLRNAAGMSAQERKELDWLM